MAGGLYLMQGEGAIRTLPSNAKSPESLKTLSYRGKNHENYPQL